MKITQYMTCNAGYFVEKPVFKAAPMLRAKQLIPANTPVAKDFLGFGVAITGSSCYNLSIMESTQRTALLQDLYGKEGLDLSVARLSVGASDYSAELYSYDDVDGDTALEHFSVERDEKYVIPMIQEILKIKPHLFLFSSPWSPPGWMKSGGTLCGGYMREEYVECYAEYYTRFLEAYRAHGIRIAALTPQNEPETHQHGKMPACIWTPDIEAKFIKILRKKLDERGLNVQIWMFDHNFESATDRVKWSLDHFEGLEQATGGVAFHYYAGAIEETATLQQAYPTLRLHFTEGGPRLYDHYDNDWCKWGIMMSKTLNHGFGSFTGWNLMLDETGGPNIGPFFCGGLVTLNSADHHLSYSGQYKALRHFSPYVDPNAEIYPVTVTGEGGTIFGYPNIGQPLQATKVKNSDGTIVYFVINPNDKKAQIQFTEGGEQWYVELLPGSTSTIVCKPL